VKQNSFNSLFVFWGWRFAWVRLLPFTLCYIMHTSCFESLSGIS